MFSFVARIWLAVVLFGMASATLPSYIKVCSRKDPDINNCIVNSVDQLRKKLATGLKELNVPAIEPLYLPHVYLTRGSGSRSNKFDVNITDLQVFHIPEFQVIWFKADPEKLKFEFQLLFPKLDFQGKYKINASFLLLKLIGEGNLNGTFNDYKASFILKGQKVVQNNITYAHFTKFKINIISANKTRIFFDNLFNGNAVLGAASNDLLNNNSDLFLQELNPALETEVTKIFSDIASKISSSFTYDELFPDI
ncbi:uncharacterized protein LOC109857251 isoform X2 [Pseudomyrmex gracilis]|uniref:uncharacterized protein LOC109857251 isoform X2 n=1 Tax=Pseudomyrmex gracilis TaxID=219809 RepID=UPI000995019D|nr:uncharacterized protein LOC109857251 isoform X2 [Pseudomyrmex gracilis]